MPSSLKIIAGPCSVDLQNEQEIYDIIDLGRKYNNAIFGVRVVGLKSRTNFSNVSSDMGLDAEQYNKIIHSFVENNFDTIKKDIKIPSVEIAKKIVSKHKDIYIASEIVDPAMQLPFYSCLGDKFIPWNPAVNQLGWQMRIMGEFAIKNHWNIGIKNAKNLGISIKDSEEENKNAPMEKVWKGLATYTKIEDFNKIFLIQRGIDDANKGDYRSYPIHKCAYRIKKDTKYKMFFDPSHTLGPKLKDRILSETIEAMKLKIDDNSFLYDGILIEVGTSKTDTDQHITIKELEILIQELSKFRTF